MTAVLDTPAPGAVSPSSARFALASRERWLLAEGGTRLDVPAGHGPDVARAVADALRDAARDGSSRALVCGVVPFDPAGTADLVLTSDVRRVPWAPAPARPAGPVPAVPDDPGYRRAVAAALARIEAGHLEKVVLARTLEHDLGPGFDVDAYLAHLAAGNPHGWTFAVRTAAGLLTGASPELVAGLSADGFASHPLAGSRPRRPGEDEPPADLLDSAKDRREHAHVVEHIAGRLAGIAADLDVPPTPAPTATDSMWHLGTRITGTLRPGTGSLDAALRIHPTPAVCGSPADRALAAVRDLEPAPRGDYAGLVGWTDAAGYGEWALVLRCALLRGGTATLSAGAGIVAGSTPEAEHAETAAKFATVLTALAAGTPTGEARAS